MKYVVVAVAVIFLIFAVASYIVYRLILMRKPTRDMTDINVIKGTQWKEFADKIRQGAKWASEQSFQKVSIASRDGKKLCARYLPCANSNKLVITVNGYHSCGLNDFAYASMFYHEHGYNVLITDQRSHGDSEGEHITMGIKERYDCLEWIKYSLDRFKGCKIILDGVSMGASTVLMTLGFDLPENVVAAIADCGFTSPWDEYKYQLRYVYHIPAFPILYFVNCWNKIFSHCDLRSYSTLKALKHNKTVPVFFAHGGKDRYVPPEMTYFNFDACKTYKKLFISENARHATSYLNETQRYQQELTAFLNEILNKDSE